MSRVFSVDCEYLLIGPDQWQQLDIALEAADVDRARELWHAWGLLLMAVEGLPDRSVADPGHGA